MEPNPKARRYRKTPIVIEAIQVEWSNWNAICDFCDIGYLEHGKPSGVWVGPDGLWSKDHPLTGQDVPSVFVADYTLGVLIPTPEGAMLAREHDWIIRGVQGEFYPCKPDIFESTYEMESR